MTHDFGQLSELATSLPAAHLPVLFEFEIRAELLEGRLDLVRLGRVLLRHRVHEPLQHRDAHLAVALLLGEDSCLMRLMKKLYM